jgi:HPt (histidine-containing phosphotransfer) domain-containing protein
MIEREELPSGVVRSNGQDRAGQDRAGQDRAGQDRAGQDEIDRVLPAMRDLRSRARVTNLARAVQLDAALERAADAALDEAARAQAVAVAHQLIGSAGTFGFSEASRRAAELKDFFAASQVADDDIQAARVRLTALRSDLQNGDPDLEF